jgi:sugar porter (SP) family MFS transporter
MNPASPSPPAAPADDFDSTYVGVIATVVALGGLLFGWDWVVIGGAKPFFESFFQLHDPHQVGWANSCALIGCLVGAVVAGGLSDRFGRKRLLILSALLFAVTSVGNALAQSFSTFIEWRMLGGVAIGLASSLAPMYISEIAPARSRGRLVSINQLTIVVGILVAQFINWCLVRHLPAGATDAFIRTSWFGTQGWRWMFGITAVPSALFLVSMLFVPESPRWLMKNGEPERARRVLARIGGDAHARRELAEIGLSISADETGRVRFSDLFDPRMGKVLLLGVVLAVFQQWCGINVIFNYAEEIFRAAGYDISSVLKNIAWTGSVNLVFTFVALGTVDRVGRRSLMLAGAGGLTLLYLALGACYAADVKGLPTLLLVLGAIACYAMSLAPVTWVVISEIFPNRIRGAAVSTAVACLWIACFVLTYTFPLLNSRLGPAGTFWLYAGVCACGFAFIAAKLPETKGKTLEELERELVDDK